MRELSIDHKPMELRLRRKALRQGLSLTKSHRRDPDAIGFGRYFLKTAGGQLLTDPSGITLDDVETFLSRIKES